MTTASSSPPAQIIPAPPRPPQQFSFDWANQLNRWLEGLVRTQSGLVYLRGSGLYLPDLPATGYGLRAGEVFSNEGVLTVVREDDIFTDSVTATTGLGSVTVTV